MAIDFALTGPVAQPLCEHSATREELSPEQLAGLGALRLRDSALRAGCDIPTYTITVRARDGSSMTFRATEPDCSPVPIVLFDEFEAWAQSTPCSWSQQS